MADRVPGRVAPGPGSRFEDWLQEQGLGLEVRRYPAGTRTAVDAARAIGCDVAQIVKSLVFTVDGQPVIVLVSGANRLDPGRLEALTGAPVGRADADAVRAATGYAIGGVPPFGHATPLPTYMDADLTAFDVVWAAAGRPDAVFPIAPGRLAELSGAQVAQLT